MKVETQKIPIYSKMTILGHKIDGIQAINNACEASCDMRKRSGDKKYQIWRLNPKCPIARLHVVKIYEPYPCFDSSDYAYENRDYNNYFFSTSPFSDEDIVWLIENIKPGINACLVHEEMPVRATPAIYFNGESSTMLLVTTKYSFIEKLKKIYHDIFSKH